MTCSGRQKPNPKDLLSASDVSGFASGVVPYSLDHSTGTGLYTTYEYPEFVPVVTIK